MPMNRKLYPKNWDQIALRVKQNANWYCQDCSRLCRIPGEDWAAFEARLVQTHPQWADQYSYPKRARFILTCAHYPDHTPSNVRSNNLFAWCSTCHLIRDKALHAANAATTRKQKAVVPVAELAHKETYVIKTIDILKNMEAKKRKPPAKPKPQPTGAQKSKAKGINIAFTPQQLAEIKKAAAIARMTIEQYVITATLEKIINQYQQ